MSEREEPRIEVTIEIRQDAETVTIYEGKKQTLEVGWPEQIPFKQPLAYVFKKLTDDFVFKFAIMQQDDFVGILYLEVPHKYKRQKRFKIEDWFALKNPDKQSLNQESQLTAWVTLKYNANVKLDDSPVKVLEAEKASRSGQKVEFNSRIKDIAKDLKEHEKEGFGHLEDVERRMRERRRKNVADASVERSVDKKKKDPAAILAHTLSKKKQVDLGVGGHSPSPRKLPVGKTVTPDELFAGGHAKGRGRPDGSADPSRVDSRLMSDYAALKEEVKKLRDRLKGLEEGQMTVDNSELAKHLSEDKDSLNKERSKLLKDFASKSDDLDRERDRLKEDLERKARAAEEALAAYSEKLEETETRDREVQQKSFELQDKEEQLSTQATSLRSLQVELASAQESVNDQKVALADYAQELDELKDKMLREREIILQQKGLVGANSEEAERIRGEAERERREADKLQKDKLKELEKRDREVGDRADRLEREKQELTKRLQDLEDIKKTFENKSKEAGSLNSNLEDERIELYNEKLKLNRSIAEFMKDKKAMEGDLKSKRMECANDREEVDELREELEADKEELEKEREALESLQSDLDTRERILVQEREDFVGLKRRFVEGILQSGNLDKMTPEMKRMARDMGLDIDELMAEDKKIQERRQQLDALKKEHEDQQ